MSWKSILKKIAPAAVALIPGLAGGAGSLLGLSGTAANLVGGGALGAVTGGLLGGRGKDALMGGALGAVSAGLAPSVKDFFGPGPVDTLATSSSAPIIPVETATLAPPGGALAQVANAAKPSFLEEYKWPLLLGGGALAAGALSEEPEALEYGAPRDLTDHRGLPSVNFNRRQIGPQTSAPYYTFGTVPFSFYEDNYTTVGDETPGGSAGNYARGGQYMAQGGLSTEPQYFEDGPGGGRDDLIDAKLSPKEFVFDAESTSLAGDGNPEEGARKLEQLRQNLRKHKGKALAKGKFSPKAKPLAQYMRSK